MNVAYACYLKRLRIRSWRLAWATEGDPVLKHNKKAKSKQNLVWHCKSAHMRSSPQDGGRGGAHRLSSSRVGWGAWGHVKHIQRGWGEGQRSHYTRPSLASTEWFLFLASCLPGSILVPGSLTKEGHAPCLRPGLAVLQLCLLPDNALGFRQRSQRLAGSEGLSFQTKLRTGTIFHPVPGPVVQFPN